MDTCCRVMSQRQSFVQRTDRPVHGPVGFALSGLCPPGLSSASHLFTGRRLTLQCPRRHRLLIHATFSVSRAIFSRIQ